MPVQLVTPTGDPFLSAHLQDRLEHWAPGAIRRTLPARHWVPRTRPDELARWIGEFATGRQSAASGPAAGAAPSP